MTSAKRPFRAKTKYGYAPPRKDESRSAPSERGEKRFAKPRRDDARKNPSERGDNRFEKSSRDAPRKTGSSSQYSKPPRRDHFDKPDRAAPRQEKPAFGERRFDKPARAETRTSGGERSEKRFSSFKRDDVRKSGGYKGKSPRRDDGFHKSRDKRGTSPRPSNAAPALPPLPKREENSVLIWGLHAVRAAWLNPKRRCFRLWITETAASGFDATLTEARDALLLKRPDPKRVDRSELERLLPPASVHQGIVLEAAPLHEPSLHDVIAGDAPPEIIIMLDQVTDPHNVGAILRSAAAFGAGAVILTERNAPSVTGVLAKSASGALEHVPQIHVVNLSRALDELQQAGYWCVGLAEEGTKDIGALDLTGRTVLVMGAEGEGLRQLTRKKCDELARLPTGGAIGSLNVSNAAAVALYEVRRQKKGFA